VTQVKSGKKRPSKNDFNAAFLTGTKEALQFPAWVVAFALIGIGSIARETGAPAGVAALSTRGPNVFDDCRNFLKMNVCHIFWDLDLPALF